MDADKDFSTAFICVYSTLSIAHSAVICCTNHHNLIATV